MNLNWLKNPDNVVYADIDKFADNFGKEVGIENLRQELENFRAKPDVDGKTITGKHRTAIKLFVPNLMFDEEITMGDTVWIYMGDMYECYCPLYALGEDCGGNYTYAENGVKDCSGCKLPHKRENYDYIMKRFSDIVELTRKS